MRTLLIVTVCGAFAVSASAWAQEAGPVRSDVPIPENPDPSQGPVLGEPALPSAAAPAQGEAQTDVQEVEVEGKKKKKLITKSKAGSTVGGVLGGLAGAAGGPVGKIVGGMVGKRIGKAVAGGSRKDKDIEDAGSAAVQASATVPYSPAVEQDQVVATQPVEPAAPAIPEAAPPLEAQSSAVQPPAGSVLPGPTVRPARSALSARVA